MPTESRPRVGAAGEAPDQPLATDPVAEAGGVATQVLTMSPGAENDPKDHAHPRPGPGARKRDPGNVANSMVATVVGNLFPPLALLVTAPILAHTLDVTGRGQVAAATAPLFLVATAATFGTPQAVNYAIARAPGVLRRAFRHASEITIASGLVATLAVFLSAHWLGGRDPKVPQLVFVAALAILPILMLTVMRGVASGLHRWKLVAIERFTSSAAELVAIAALALLHQLTPLSATIVLAFSPVTGMLPYLGVFKKAPRGPDYDDPVGDRSQIFSFGLRVWVGALTGTLLARLDQVVMTPLAGAYQLGLYSAAVTVSQIPLVINTSVRDVTFSSDAAARADDRLGASARISSFASAVVGLMVGVSMIWWLPIFFGEDFSPAVPIAAVLIVGVVVGTPGSIAGAGLSARGRPGLRSSSLVVASIVNVALVFLLVPPYGAMGAAIATLIGNLISANGCVLLLWRVAQVNPRELHGLRRRDIVRIRRFAKRTYRALSAKRKGGRGPASRPSTTGPIERDHRSGRRPQPGRHRA